MQISREYGLKIRAHHVIRDTEKTMVIHLKTDRGSFFAKCMYVSEERHQFILEAEEYLRNRGIHIPKVRLTLSGRPCFVWQGKLFFLQQEIPGKLYSLKKPKQIQRVGALLGRIHASSVGFLSSSGMLFNGALAWEQEYESDLLSMKSWQKQHARMTKPKIALIHAYLPFFLRTGSKMQKQLQQSAFFQRWKGRPEHLHSLCHGDFHMGNVIVSEDKLNVIDWEDVRYDYPSKDLNRLLMMLMRRQRKWKEEKCRMLLKAYFKQNPMNKAEKTLLYQDLAFPHIFERFLRQKLYKQMDYGQVMQFLQREQEKTKYMLKQAKARIPK